LYQPSTPFFEWSILAAFGQTLLALKVYSARNVIIEIIHIEYVNPPGRWPVERNGISLFHLSISF